MTEQVWMTPLGEIFLLEKREGYTAKERREFLKFIVAIGCERLCEL